MELYKEWKMSCCKRGVTCARQTEQTRFLQKPGNSYPVFPQKKASNSVSEFWNIVPHGFPCHIGSTSRTEGIKGLCASVFLCSHTLAFLSPVCWGSCNILREYGNDVCLLRPLENIVMPLASIVCLSSLLQSLVLPTQDENIETHFEKCDLCDP